MLPKSRMGKAIEYTYALLPRLSRYVNDGRIEIDDNRIENVLSKIPYNERDKKDMTELLPRNWAKSNQTCSE